MKIRLLFFLLAFTSVSSHAQIKVIQGENSIRFENVRNVIYLDAEGKETTKAEQNAFLEKNLNYTRGTKVGELDLFRNC